MHWADKVAKEVVASRKYKPYWVDDMKTPSGFAHVGSMMGPVIHSCIFRALRDVSVDAEFTFVINDFDPADDLLPELGEKYKQYLGVPLKLAPSPDPKFKSMADLYSNDFINTFRKLGVEAKILSSWEMYHQGKFDNVIKVALDNTEKIQNIYRKISGSKKKEKDWLPFQVICEKCGKLGTTRVFSWDGEKVSYVCEPNMVTWAKGCGHTGKISPFGGNGKLPWKVDWAAHWKVIGVTIEGAGKDHASAGGSYDIAMSLVKDIFGAEKPYKLPYEFILIGGRKMSSSKGIGLKAHDLFEVLPISVARFLFVGTDIKSQSNFNPVDSMAIPDLFDAYDKAWGKCERSFVLSQVGKVPKKGKIFKPRFRDVANYIQQPSVDIYKKFEGEKGEDLSQKEKDLIDERIKFAKVWLEKYAPKEKILSLTEKVPKEINKLSSKQKQYLKKVVEIIEGEKNPEKLQVKLYDLSKDIGLTTKDAFASIYITLIGKSHGPKAAWFLLENKKEAIERLRKV
ncbi:lysine--tRNA ligase [Patescibacteria group bacterium]